MPSLWCMQRRTSGRQIPSALYSITIPTDNTTTHAMNSGWITTLKNEYNTRLSASKDVTPTSIPAVVAERITIFLTLSSK